MQVVLLSGGSGKRLWPLSNEIQAKQFIKIFPKDRIAGEPMQDLSSDKERESMVQRVYSQIRRTLGNVPITIATSVNQVATLKAQLHGASDVSLSIEPCRRDTFPAIALVAAYLADVKKIDLNESIIVAPIDPCVNDDFFAHFQLLDECLKTRSENLILLGVSPTYPSEKYGYIIPEANFEFDFDFEKIGVVRQFKEKPSSMLAQDYIAQGALWNAGVFAFRLKYVLEKAHELIDFTNYYDLKQKYTKLKKISFDYAVVEEETSIAVVRYSGFWKDLGTWNTLTEEMGVQSIGNVLIDPKTCENVHAINMLDIPLLCVGIRNATVAVSPSGLLFTGKRESSHIKPLVAEIEERTVQPVMFGEKVWGEYKMIDVEGDNSLTVKILLNAHENISYHAHKNRTETWVVLEGFGHVILDGKVQPIQQGDTITMKPNVKHTIVAKTNMKLLEIQTANPDDENSKITVNDKIIYDLDVDTTNL